MFLEAGAGGVVGLDYNADALTRARAHHADARVEYRQWDLNQTPLPLPDGRFDVVVCLEVLEHVREQRALVAEFFRVLKPGGRLILSVPDRAYEEQFTAFNGYRNTYHVHVPERQEFEQLLTGFTQLRFARQIDFIGSCVLEDDAEIASGDWGEQPPGPSKCTLETVFAVAVKPPANLARPVPPYRPHLRLFDNALALHLRWRSYTDGVERELALEKAQVWSDRNRYESKLQRLMKHGPLRDPGWQREFLQAWFRDGTPAYSCAEVLPGDWIARFEEVLASRGEPHPRGDFQRPVHWEFRSTRTGAMLRIPDVEPRTVGTVLYPCPEGHVGLRALWQWKKRGAQTVWFHEAGGWKQYDLPGYIAWRIARFVGRRALPWLACWQGPDIPRAGVALMRWAMRLRHSSRPALLLHPYSGASCRAALQEKFAEGNEPVGGRRDVDRRLKVTHYISALHAGGAERQLCNLVQGQKRRGIDVRVLTMSELKLEQAHYAELLAEEKVPLRQAGRPYIAPSVHDLVAWPLLRSVPVSIQSVVVNLVYELLADRPNVVHCWLDQPNVIGAIAGLMAGVPHIVLSTRNSNPTNFPRLLEDFLQEWYQLAARSSRVHFIANSHSGAASYAEWIGVPVERFHVVFNGVCFDHFPQPTPELRRQARQSFGLSAEDSVVCGLFRLAAEKQPELFLDVVRRVQARVPRLKVLLAGVGDLEERVHEIVRETGMDRYVQLLGRRSDVGTIFMASDASLLTSTLEGCPNVALESQYLGVPIVATAGGGTVDAVEHGVTGFLAEVSDAATLADSLTRILLDESLCRRLSAAGPQFVQQRFALEHMVDQTMAVYEIARLPSPHSRRVLPREQERAGRAA